MNKSRILSWEGSLVQRAATGDTHAFRLLSDQHSPSLRRLAMRILRDPNSADDVVQESLCKAWRSLPAFEPDRPIRPWLLRICRNCCIDALRASSGHVPIDGCQDWLTSESDGPDRCAFQRDERQLIEQAIEELPADYQRVVRMRHFEELEVLEIARALRRPEGTIKSWLHRARAMLARSLRPAL